MKETDKMNSGVDHINEIEPGIDPWFNAGFFERLIAFVKEILFRIFGGFPKTL